MALVIHHFLSAIRESRHKVLLKIGIPMRKSLKNSCEWVDLFKNLQASYDLFKVTSILIYVFIICKQLLPLNIFQWLFLSIFFLLLLLLFFLFFCFAFFVFFLFKRLPAKLPRNKAIFTWYKHRNLHQSYVKNWVRKISPQSCRFFSPRHQVSTNWIQFSPRITKWFHFKPVTNF